MKVKLRNKGGAGPEKVAIRGEYIKLDALLKFAGLVETGGEAKLIIQNGDVKINGECCTQRCKKIVPGTIVRMGSSAILVVSAGE